MKRKAYPAAPVTMAFLWCRRPISNWLIVRTPFVGGLFDPEDIFAGVKVLMLFSPFQMTMKLLDGQQKHFGLDIKMPWLTKNSTFLVLSLKSVPAAVLQI
jgi:hypothetical protein